MHKPSKRQKIKGSILIALYLLFLLWVKSWLGLILLPFIIDIYFTRFIPWGFWKSIENSFVRTIFSWIDAIVFALIAVYLVNIFIFQNYQIPTSSLEKSLLVGDHLFVSKMSYGPRIPNTPIALPIAHNTLPGGEGKSYLEKPYWNYKRVGGLGEIKRNQIVVFNYPAGDTLLTALPNMDYYKFIYEVGYNVVQKVPQLDSLSLQQQRAFYESVYTEGKKVANSHPEYYGETITHPVDRRDNYVKRCLALPGETLHIIDSKVYINNVHNEDAPGVQFNYYVQTTGDYIPQNIFKELGINIADQSLLRRDVRVEDKLKQNQTVEHKQGVNDTELEEIISKYSDRSKFTIFVSNNAQCKFLSQAGFNSDGFKGESHYIYRLPLTKKMYDELRGNTLLISNIIQEPATAKISDNPYEQLLIYPLNGYTKWDKNNYGPIWMPKKGESIELNLANLPIYERCIRTYESNKLEVKGDQIFINDQLATSYTFKMDYYWMMGDNRDNSLDSRYWGFVPEDHIVGKPLFVWLSLEKDNDWLNGKIRWNRFFKWVK